MQLHYNYSLYQPGNFEKQLVLKCVQLNKSRICLKKKEEKSEAPVAASAFALMWWWAISVQLDLFPRRRSTNFLPHNVGQSCPWSLSRSSQPVRANAREPLLCSLRSSVQRGRPTQAVGLCVCVRASPRLLLRLPIGSSARGYQLDAGWAWLYR